MKKVILIVFIILLGLITLMYSLTIVSNISYDKELKNTMKDINIVQKPLEHKNNIFFSSDSGKNKKIDFSENSQIKLVISTDIMNNIWHVLDFDQKKFIIFYDENQENIAKKLKNIIPNSTIVMIKAKDSLIKIMNEKASNVNGYIFFQNSSFLTIGTQQLIGTLMLKIKKIIISFGLSSQFPSVLTFMPKGKDLYIALNNYEQKGEKEQVILNNVKFNLRYAAFIQMKFKNDIFKFVKQKI